MHMIMIDNVYYNIYIYIVVYIVYVCTYIYIYCDLDSGPPEIHLQLPFNQVLHHPAATQIFWTPSSKVVRHTTKRGCLSQRCQPMALKGRWPTLHNTWLP